LLSQDAGYSLGGPGPDGKPIIHALFVKANTVLALHQGIVSAQFFNEFSITRRSDIGYSDAIKWPIAPAHSFKPYLYRHFFLLIAYLKNDAFQIRAMRENFFLPT
jgi:hypothetical protein